MSARKVRTTRRAKIDIEFAQMANDPIYRGEALQVAEEFAKADWEALRVTERNV
jgi:hypothetical protein